mgnify:CR=1 FL=1
MKFGSKTEASPPAHAKASPDLAAFALNVHGPFVTKANGERQSLGGEAMKQKRLDGSDGDIGLFRRLSKSRAKTGLTLASVTSQIREAEAELESLKARKAELEAEAKAKADAEADRQRKEAELAELQKLAAETQEKAKALRTELGHN